jgi:hypothetical protein
MKAVLTFGRVRMTIGRLRGLAVLVLIFAFAAGCNGNGGGSQSPGIVHFVPNSHAFWSDPDNWTTSFGPAYANVVVTSTNFLPCRGGPYALCYYSGPSSGSENLSCTLTAGRTLRELQMLRDTLRSVLRRYQRDPQPCGL